MVDIWVLVGNICQRPAMSQAHVDSDLYDARNSGADVVILNEIGLERYKSAVRRIFGHTNWDVNFLNNTQDPVLVKKDKGLIVSLLRTIRLNDGVKLVTPRRNLNLAKVHFDEFDDSVIFMGTHWVSGKDNRLRFRRKLRKKLWEKNYKCTQEEIDYWNHRGHWVVLAGDINDMHTPPFFHRMKWYGSGIVKFGISEPDDMSKTDIVITAPASDVIKNVFTDHPFKMLKLRIVKKNQ